MVETTTSRSASHIADDRDTLPDPVYEEIFNQRSEHIDMTKYPYNRPGRIYLNFW